MGRTDSPGLLRNVQGSPVPLASRISLNIDSQFLSLWGAVLGRYLA